MARLTVDWTELTGPHAAAPDVWVFGILVDAVTAGAGRFVVRPPGLSGIDVTVRPLGGLAVAGVVAVAWDGLPPGDAGGPYGAVADVLDEVVGERVASAGLEAPTDRALRDLGLRVDQDVGDTLRTGWSVLDVVPGQLAGVDRCLLTLDGPVEDEVDLALSRRSTRYRLRGRLRYSVALR